MPSTLVHAALAGLLAAALLGRAFRLRTLALVVGLVILVDLDVFLGYVVLGAHRAAFHTLLWPALASVAVGYDTLVRDRSALVGRFGRDAPRVAWTSIATVVFAAIGPDLVTNGANLLYPVHDQFYAFDGSIKLSSKEGIVQTFVEEQQQVSRGSTEQTQYYTGADPDPSTGGSDAETTTERVFLVVDSGFQLLLVVTSAVVVAGRLFADAGTPQVGDAGRAADADRAGDAGSASADATPDAGSAERFDRGPVRAGDGDSADATATEDAGVPGAGDPAEADDADEAGTDDEADAPDDDPWMDVPEDSGGPDDGRGTDTE